ncbi:Os03g0226501, partial [Oryza sativa Japonica Group]
MANSLCFCSAISSSSLITLDSSIESTSSKDLKVANLMRGGLSSVVPSRRPLEREKSTWDGLSGSTASSTFLGSRDTNSPRIDPTELRRRSARSGA